MHQVRTHVHPCTHVQYVAQYHFILCNQKLHYIVERCCIYYYTFLTFYFRFKLKIHHILKEEKRHMEKILLIYIIHACSQTQQE